MNSVDPILVDGMRRWPTGEVLHLPSDEGVGKGGTSTEGFLREYDAAMAAAWELGYQAGVAHTRDYVYWSMTGAPSGNDADDGSPRTPKNPYRER